MPRRRRVVRKPFGDVRLGTYVRCGKAESVGLRMVSSKSATSHCDLLEQGWVGP